MENKLMLKLYKRIGMTVFNKYTMEKGTIISFEIREDIGVIYFIQYEGEEVLHDVHESNLVVLLDSEI
jgi:hypothetical protein